MAMLLRALEHKGDYWWVGPAADQVEVAISVMFSVLKDFDGADYSISKRRLYLPNGSTITFKSAGSDKSLRGWGLCGMVLDEAAIIDENKWIRDLSPSLADNAGWVIMCSTPAGYNWFADLREKVLSLPDWEVYSFPTWANPSPNLTREKIEAKKALMGENAWGQEYLGVPTATEYALWPPQFFDDIFVDSIPTNYARASLGIDLSEGGKASDWQALVHCGHQAGMHYLDCRNRRVPVPALLREAKAMTDHYHTDVVIVDCSGGQAMIHEQLEELWPQREGLKPVRFEIKEHVPKESRIQQLAYLLDRKFVKILKNSGGLEYVKEGRDFPDGDYDDMLDCHQLAWRGLHAPV